MRLNLLACVALFLVAGTVAAQDVDALQLRNRRLQEEIAALEKRIQSAAGTIRGQLTQYRMGQSLLKSRQELIRGMEEIGRASCRERV